MKTVVVGFGVFVLCLLLLAGSAMMIGSSSEAVQRGGSSGACRSGVVDSDAVARQVAAILDGASDTDVQIEGLTLPGVQIPHARTIVAAGISLHVPRRGQIVAIATAMQESRLRNLGYGDRDSLGLFQQRPSQGWGTADQIRDPVYSSERFYKALLSVDGWEQLTVTQAAQAVQWSGHPDAYAQWEDLATALQKAIASTFPSTGTAPGDDTAPSAGCGPESDGSGFGPIPAGKVPRGYKIPVGTDPRARKALEWAMFQLGTMYQWGGTCTDARGPDPMGRCDCSSLMQQAYARVGIKLTRTTYTQVKEGDPVSADKLRPGDLIFSRGSADRPEHVGMAMGAGLAIEAPRTGKPVRISPLQDWTILVVRRVL